MAVEDALVNLVHERFNSLKADIDHILTDLEVQRDRMRQLLKNVGGEGVCKGCLAEIIWVKHRNGRTAPYDLDGANHFIACPNREQFKRDKKEYHA